MMLPWPLARLIKGFGFKPLIPRDWLELSTTVAKLWSYPGVQLTNILTASTKTLDHVLARLVGEALISLENDDAPPVDGAWRVETLSNHVPGTVAGLNCRFFAALAVSEHRRGQDTSVNFERSFGSRLMKSLNRYSRARRNRTYHQQTS